MARSHGDGDLIAAIYDAIIEPSGWNDVVKRIVEATGSVSGVIGIHQVDRPARRIVSALVPAMYNIDPFWSDAFVQNYHKNNPLDVQVLAAMPGKVLASAFITQTDSFKACAFYNEFMRPQGQAENVGIGLVRTPITAGYLALQRSPASISLEPEQWKLLEKLGPHLQRAAIHEFLSRAREAKESLGAAVAAAGFAVFLLTGDSRVVFANAKAEDLVRRGTVKITELTARTHAKHIFDKTGTSRQTELIRRFFETALPGSPGGA